MPEHFTSRIQTPLHPTNISNNRESIFKMNILESYPFEQSGQNDGRLPTGNLNVMNYIYIFDYLVC